MGAVRLHWPFSCSAIEGAELSWCLPRALSPLGRPNPDGQVRLGLPLRSPRAVLGQAWARVRQPGGLSGGSPLHSHQAHAVVFNPLPHCSQVHPSPASHDPP